MLRQTDILFPADHPTAVGHFPGNPIIPGAVLLDTALTAIATATGRGRDACRLRSAKFLRPIRPGDRLLIEWRDGSDGGFTFTGSIDGQPVLNGVVAP
ncbi:hypothetical protein [Azospirillum picis]|uniref:3-hydroxymyristoyl/3-hydroxydecanoyl-(Acyl carrier protein) dehydratase n=1 Tax=Azospirillum picis TaxID=488438 RepID=A0ABU0MRD5_9PROT|nr:hypothetical protein [Azospirillum picis]MBP2302028.1 3-hydroxymyristoyl/3-hydroxydecanoyl-(acyl carrier protein) dehydratase [Azospirillum picis]MDQ0535681.1 3-hydroxymyristoyl/3-hydroxydecanoyl-(acyl carrier protein) dehydratase [Azospirillum picis]